MGEEEYIWGAYVKINGEWKKPVEITFETEHTCFTCEHYLECPDGKHDNGACMSKHTPEHTYVSAMGTCLHWEKKKPRNYKWEKVNKDTIFEFEDEICK